MAQLSVAILILKINRLITIFHLKVFCFDSCGDCKYQRAFLLCFLQVLEQHLACAALEHPLSLQHDEKHFGSGLSNAVELLKNRGFLSFDPSRDSSAEFILRIWTYIGREVYPSNYIERYNRNRVSLLLKPLLVDIFSEKTYAESLYPGHRGRKIHSHGKKK